MRKWILVGVLGLFSLGSWGQNPAQPMGTAGIWFNQPFHALSCTGSQGRSGMWYDPAAKKIMACDNGGAPYALNSGGGGGTPGGSDGQLQYNKAGAFAGMPSSTVNTTTGTLFLQPLAESPALALNSFGIGAGTAVFQVEDVAANDLFAVSENGNVYAGVGTGGTFFAALGNFSGAPTGQAQLTVGSTTQAASALDFPLGAGMNADCPVPAANHIYFCSELDDGWLEVSIGGLPYEPLVIDQYGTGAGGQLYLGYPGQIGRVVLSGSSSASVLSVLPDGSTLTVSGGLATGAGNTDLAGLLTASAGTANYSFTDTYTTAPVCIVQDDTLISSLLSVTVSTTTLTVTTTGATDLVAYHCIGLN